MRRISKQSLLIVMMVSGAILALGISVVALSLDTEPDERPAFLQLPVMPTPRIVDHQDPLYVKSMQVEINPASTEPIMVHVQGELADGCHGMRLGLIHYRGQSITTTLYMGYRQQGYTTCTLLTRPTALSFPVEVGGLAPGDYILSVNGLSQSLSITPELIAAQPTPNRASIVVDSIQYFAEDEQGRPFIRVQGRSIMGCPHVISILQRTDAMTITLTADALKIAPPVNTTPCHETYATISDTQSWDIPLDLIGLPLGEYTVVMVNHQLKFNLDNPPPTP